RRRLRLASRRRRPQAQQQAEFLHLQGLDPRPGEAGHRDDGRMDPGEQRPVVRPSYPDARLRGVPAVAADEDPDGPALTPGLDPCCQPPCSTPCALINLLHCWAPARTRPLLATLVMLVCPLLARHGSMARVLHAVGGSNVPCDARGLGMRSVRAARTTLLYRSG